MKGWASQGALSLPLTRLALQLLATLPHSPTPRAQAFIWHYAALIIDDFLQDTREGLNVLDDPLLCWGVRPGPAQALPDLVWCAHIEGAVFNRVACVEGAVEGKRAIKVGKAMGIEGTAKLRAITHHPTPIVCVIHVRGIQAAELPHLHVCRDPPHLDGLQVLLCRLLPPEAEAVVEDDEVICVC